MSIKKLLEKVVVGATVGALVVLGAVGVASAQRSPYFTGNPQNAALDVKAGTAELPILFNVDLRAVLYALPNTGPDGFTTGLETAWTGGLPGSTGNTTDSIANVGWLFVETNYSAWDILVNRENGGYLVREVYPGETPDTLGGLDVETCVQGNGPFGSTITTCDTTREGGRLGKALQYAYNDGTDDVVGPCSLDFAVGVIKLSELTTAAQIINKIKLKASTDFVQPLLFDDGTDSYDYASFAYSLGQTGVPSTVSGYFGTTAAAQWGALDLDDGVFPALFNGTATSDVVARLRLDNELGDPYTTVPNPSDPAIVFFINARLAIDKTVTPAERLTGNRNGTYTENLIFTFYGLY